MNGIPPRIEIFGPFSAAFELTKKILFRPFDITKWFVIGFAAFLAHLAGGGLNSGMPRGFGNSAKWNTQSVTSGASDTIHNFPGWLIPLAIVGGIVFLAIVILCLWVGSRGKFVFTDCIVRDRAAIQEPWREFRREGNSLFAFSLIVAVLFLAVLLIGGVPILLPIISHGSDATIGLGLGCGIAFVALLLVILAIGWALVSQFMVPVMYRRRCTATEAFSASLALVRKHFGAILLYFLFLIVLGLGAAMISCIATCVTCCITAIPYLGTVILLPVYVLLAAYPLLFLRQFGPDYDAWAEAAPIVTGAMTLPPAQTPPPPPSSEPPMPPTAPPTIP